LKAIARLSPGFLSLSGHDINMDSSVDKIMWEVGRHSSELDRSLLDRAYAVALLEEPPLPPPLVEADVTD